MKELIDTLQAQHNAVAVMVDRINASIAKGDTRAISTTLGELKSALLAHLELEDNQLYPQLIQAAEKQGDPTIAQTTKMFSSGMVLISDTLKTFLGRYERKKDFSVDEFKKDWREVTVALSARINQEESSLYPLYNKWVK
jgi:hypothetical protein